VGKDQKNNKTRKVAPTRAYPHTIIKKIRKTSRHSYPVVQEAENG